MRKTALGIFALLLFTGPAPAASAPRASAVAGPEKEWTVMVFINAKNDLEYYGLKDLNEMEVVGSSGQMNVVVELGRMAGHDDSEGDWTGSRRYLVQKDGDVKNITSPVVEELPRVDMGDYEHLIDFARWAKARYPARKYMLIVWSHGTGWLKGAKGPGKGISYDYETGSHINTPQLGRALGELGGVDIYASDACLMQMAEVAYEIKDHASYLIGSEETIPGDGYPYNVFLAALAARPAMAPAELAGAVVDAYADYYKARGIGSTHSYIRAAALEGFAAVSDAFTRAVIRSGEKALVEKVLDAAQSYAYWENRDLYHFAQLVAAGSGSAEVRKASGELMKYVAGELVGRNRTTNGAEGGWWVKDNYDNSHGLAVYLPVYGAPALPAYAGLAWTKRSAWNEFIAWLARP